MIVPLVWALTALGSQPEAENRLLSPAELEIRALAGTNFLAFNYTAGLSAEVGVAPLRRGTLALGLDYSYGACLSICAAIGLFTGLEYRQAFHFPSLRATWHFALPPNPSLRRVDLFVGGVAGVAVALLDASTPEGPTYRGRSIGPSAAFVAGLSWFFTQRVFAGFELRARLAPFDMAITMQRPDYHFRDAVETRSYASGFNWNVLLGVRL